MKFFVCARLLFFYIWAEYGDSWSIVKQDLWQFSGTKTTLEP